MYKLVVVDWDPYEFLCMNGACLMQSDKVGVDGLVSGDKDSGE